MTATGTPVAFHLLMEQRTEHNAKGHEAGHHHGAACGHEAVRHGGHSDYVVEGRLHHAHNDHCDDLGVCPPRTEER